MPNPAMPDHTGLCFRPADCFHQDDDRRDHSGVCFHPGDDRRGDAGICFHPGDEPVAIGTGSSVSPCHHPSEPGDEKRAEMRFVRPYSFRKDVAAPRHLEMIP